MSFLYILLIAISLGIDAFAVSMAAGAYLKKANKRQVFRLSFHFGLFQFFMPILGWLLGSKFAPFISNVDHWIAFGILSIIGGKMIHEALTNDEDAVSKDISKGMYLIAVSVGTSIDALAVGFSIGILNDQIFIPSIIIGIITASMSFVGIKLGEKLTHKFGNTISIFGGIVLIIIGLKIALEHLGYL